MSSADSTRVAPVSTGAPAMVVTLDGLADPVIAISTDGLLRYANDTAALVLGWDRTELLGSSVLELVHPDDLNLALASLRTIRDKRVGDLVSLRVT
jgi:PAS domain S-box-containing protein